MGPYRATCDRCGLREDHYVPLRVYVLVDGRTLGVEWSFVWCHTCKAVRQREVLRDVLSIEQDLREDRTLFARFTPPNESERSRARRLQEEDEDYRRYLDEVRQRLSWRIARVAGPRCLECGAERIQAFEYSHTPFDSDADLEERWTLLDHPGCGGVLTIIADLRLRLDRSWLKYTPEGLSL